MTEIKKKTLVVSHELRELAFNLKSALIKPGEPGACVHLAMFLGAGASFQSGINTTKEMIADFKRKILEYYSVDIADEAGQNEWIRSQPWFDKYANEYGQLFEQCYKTESIRRSYIERIAEKPQISVGYIVLANLIKSGYINTLITTNFDNLISLSCLIYADTIPVVYSLGRCVEEMMVPSPRPSVIKLHGDFLYSRLANTEKELNKAGIKMKKEVITALKRHNGIIIIGYSGNDDSVMNILEKIPDEKIIYWCDFSIECISARARKLLKNRGQKGVFVPIEGFDEMMQILRILVGIPSNSIIEPFQNRNIELNKKFREFEHVILVDEEKKEIKYTNTTDFGDILEKTRELSLLLLKANEAVMAKNFFRLNGYYDDAIKLNPNNPTIYNRFGLLFEQNEGYWKTAEEIYRTAMDKFPANEQAYYYLATLLIKDEKRWGEAEDLFHEAINKNPNSAIAISCLGFLFYKQKVFPEAIKFFNKAIDLDRKLPFPYVNLSAVYKEMGCEKKSLEFNEKAKETLKPIDYYQWACVKSITREKEEALSFLKKSIEQEPGRKLAAKYSPTFDWMRNDSDFNKLINN